MNNLYSTYMELAQWLDHQQIDYALARPKYNEEDFKDTDLDFMIRQSSIPLVMEWLKQRNCVITCQYERVDGLTVHFAVSAEQQNRFFHIDFITSLEVIGLSFLNINDVLNRKVQINSSYYLDPIDQAIVLMAIHGLKHKNPQKLVQYLPFLQMVTANNMDSVQQAFQITFGKAQGTDILLAIKNNDIMIPSYSHFTLSMWYLHGLRIVISFILHYFQELLLRFSRRNFTVAFLGVDGAGKTTLINALKENLYDCYPVIKHVHFLPTLFGDTERDSNIIQSDPHGKNQRGYVLSLLKLFYFFVIYWLHRLQPKRKPVFYLFDRYIYDLIIDPKRFRYNGIKDQVLWRILTLFPQPEITFVLDVPPELAQTRKSEVSLSETIRQTNEYRELKENLSAVTILKNDFPLDKVEEFSRKQIISSLVDKNK